MLVDKDKLKEYYKKNGVKDTDSLNKLLGQLSKEVIELLMKEELTGFLGYEKYKREDKTGSNSRNGNSEKTVKSSFGEILLDIPRDRESQFDPTIVPKGMRDLGGLEEKVVALYARGMSTRDISSYIKSIYGCSISAELVSTMTESVCSRVADWQERPLEKVYAIVFLDGMQVNMRLGGAVQKVVVYTMLGINLTGHKDILGLWIGATESAKYWLQLLNNLKNRGVQDVLIFSVDNLSGISEAIKACFPTSEIQKCIIHQIRNSVKNVAKRRLKEVCEDLKSIYTAPDEKAALVNLDKFEKKWQSQYPYIARSWRKNWEELKPYFKYPPEIRRLVYTTNPIESVNRAFRKVIKTKAVFPNEDSLIKILFLVVEKLSKKWERRIPGWTEIYPQLTIYFKERLQELEEI